MHGLTATAYKETQREGERKRAREHVRIQENFGLICGM
jgi:hypothetical protein